MEKGICETIPRKDRPKSLQEIAEYIAEGRRDSKPSPHPFDHSKMIVGDIFYSSIQGILRSQYKKKYSYEDFHTVCQILEEKGFWVHS